MKEIAIIRGGLAAALSVAAAACSTGTGDKTDLNVRPMMQQTGDNLPADAIYYQDAVSAIGRRDYATALDYLQAARAKDPRNVRVLNAFGVVYDKLGRFDLSARYYAQANALDPGSATVARNIAYSRMLQGVMDPQLAASEPPAAPPSAQIAGLVSTPDEAGAPPIAAPTIPVTVQPAVAIEAAALSTLTFAGVKMELPDEPDVHIASLPKIEQVATPDVNGPKMASAALPAAARTSNISPAAKDTLLIGRPLRIVNAAGRQGATDPVRYSLSALGWSVSKLKPTSATALKFTTISYPVINTRVVQALVRTLPFPARLVPDPCGCHGVQLVIGSDFLNWKATGRRVPNIWRTNLDFAALSTNKGIQ